MEWVEVPAHRVLVITLEEFEEHFVSVNENGQAADRCEMPYMIVRKKDGKQFRPGRWYPVAPNEKIIRLALEEW